MSEKLLKVYANYPPGSEALTLWGIKFSLIDSCYVAEVEKSLGESLVESGRCRLKP